MLDREQQQLSPYNAIARMVCSSFAVLTKRCIETQSSLDLARVACALERYRLAHGEYPATLEPLAPQFMAIVPSDVLNGQPLHYVRTAAGNFKLYSVGWNETDDGGTPGLNDSKRSDFRKGDWVWQYPLNASNSTETMFK